jgi:hypothetical protein
VITAQVQPPCVLDNVELGGAPGYCGSSGRGVAFNSHWDKLLHLLSEIDSEIFVEVGDRDRATVGAADEAGPRSKPFTRAEVARFGAQLEAARAAAERRNARSEELLARARELADSILGAPSAPRASESGGASDLPEVERQWDPNDPRNFFYTEGSVRDAAAVSVQIGGRLLQHELRTAPAPVAQSADNAIVVVLKGLVGVARHNGKRATVYHFDARRGRFTVQLEEADGTQQLRVKPANIQVASVPSNFVIGVDGLVGAAQHNGKRGRVIRGPDAKTGRYKVQLEEGGKPLGLKLQNLRLVEAMEADQLAQAMALSMEELELGGGAVESELDELEPELDAPEPELDEPEPELGSEHARLVRCPGDLQMWLLTMGMFSRGELTQHCDRFVDTCVDELLRCLKAEVCGLEGAFAEME